MSKNKKRQRSSLAGYRLHNKRLMFSGGNSIRTIKFPLVPYGVEGRKKKEKKQEYRDRIQKACRENKLFLDTAGVIRSDYRNMCGPLNINDYQDCSESKEICYSLKDFIVDSWRAGVTLHPKLAERDRVIKQVVGNVQEDDDKQQKAIEKVNPKFYELVDNGFINFEKFKAEFITPTSIKTDVKKKLARCVVDNEGRQREVTDKEQKTIDRIADDLDRIKSDNKGSYWWHPYFGIDKSIDKTKKTTSKEVGEPTFYIYPCLDFNTKLTETECVKRIGDFIKEKKLKNQTEHDLLGTSQNHNAMSNYYNKVLKLLIDGQLDVIRFLVLNSSSLWNGREDDLDKRLEFLSKKAKKLKRPQIVSGWDHYRSDIGGSIRSWISGSARQDIEIRKSLYGYKEEKNKSHICDVKRVKEALQEFKEYFRDNRSRLRQLKDVEQLVNRLDQYLKTNELKINTEKPDINDDDLFIYRKDLNEFTEKFNNLYQARYGLKDLDEESIKDVKVGGKKIKFVNKEYPKLFGTLPKVPKFFGEVKIESGGVYDKYFNSYQRLELGVQFLKSITINYSSKIDNDMNDLEKIERIKKALNSILRLYRTADSDQIKNQLIKPLLKNYCKNPKQLEGVFNYFYRSERAREKRGDEIKLQYTDEELLNQINSLIKHLDKFEWKLQGLDSSDWINKVQEWGAGIEIAKIKIGFASTFYNINADFENKKYHKYFPQLPLIKKRYEKFENNTHDKNIIIQQSIFSEMRGIIAQMSKEEIIARYVVQPMNSDEEYPVVMKDNNYYIDLGKFTKQRDSQAEEMCNISKGKDLLQDKKNINKVYQSNLLTIRSSKYQTQFLNNSFNQKWKKLFPALSSYSFIVEDTLTVKWIQDGKLYRPIFDVNDTQLFVSIPFDIGIPKYPQKKKWIEKKYREKAKKRSESIDKQRKFIGIDIGEFGVAHYLLDGDNLSSVSKQQGFFFQPDMRKIRDEIKENKRTQKAGTFTGTNTKIKRIRDNATTKIRNKIHKLVVENSAFPVYEWEVSNFESGSNKISKVYDSIKRSDVTHSKIEAEKQEHQLVWGNSFFNAGKEIGAYATSQMCSHCKDSIYAYFFSGDDKEKKYDVLEGSDVKGVFVIGIEKKEVYAYSNPNKKEYKPYKQGGKIKGQDVVRHIREYQRPPVRSLLKLDNLPEHIRRGLEFETRDKNGKGCYRQGQNGYFIKDKNGNLTKNKHGRKSRIKPSMSEWEYTRGNSAIYRCAFTDCNEYSDADIQAALWIALKGLIREKNPKEWKKQKTKEQIKCLLEFARNKNIKPVELCIEPCKSKKSTKN